MKNFRYQNEVVGSTINSLAAFESGGSLRNNVLIQAVTGAGKTVMASKIIEELIKFNDYTFIWVSPAKGDIHIQSLNSIKRNIAGISANLLNMDFINSNNILETNSLLVFSWDSVFKKKANKTALNKVMQDSDGENFITVLDRTHENENKIVLFIDEAHNTSEGFNAQELIGIINPFFTISITATPRKCNTFTTKHIIVDTSDVADAGMIKRNILINENLRKSESSSLRELIVLSALDKRNELAEAYIKEKSNIKPLMLIQLPDKNVANISDPTRSIQEEIEIILATVGITRDNGKLGIHLSDLKINHEDIINSDVEVLIFKTAITEGWDCPRSHVLVRCREIKSTTFNIQTVGRIMRMPEHKHYNNTSLNSAYVYTDLEDDKVLISSDDIGFISKQSKIATLDAELLGNGFKLAASFRERQQEQRKAYSKFMNKVINKLRTPEMKENIVRTKTVTKEITTDGVMTYDFDSEFISKSSTSIILKPREVQKVFYDKLKKHYNNEDFDVLRHVMIDRIRVRFGFSNDNDATVFLIHNLTLILNLMEELQSEGNTTKIKRIINTFEWKPVNRRYNDNANDYGKLHNINKSLLVPCYDDFDSNLERKFILFLEKESTVKAYYRNGGSQSRENFSIATKEGTFYPDFIVLFNDHSIGIYDTKAAGKDIEDTTIKANILADYVKHNDIFKIEKDSNGEKVTLSNAEVNSGLTLRGGIVIYEQDEFKIHKIDNKYVDYNKSTANWIKLTFNQ